MNRIFNALAPVAAALLSIASGYSQSATDSLQPVRMDHVLYRDIHAAAVGDDFRLYFTFPPGYDTATRKFPVLYVTDGDWSFANVLNCFSTLRQDYITVEPVIISIGYGKGKNQRNRDLDPSNGAANFLAFLSKEVIPYVEEHFKVSEERALYGYSLGGLFTSYVLFHQPELFNSFLIGAPGGNGVELVQKMEEHLQSRAKLPSKIFLGVGSFELETVKNIGRFKTFVAAKKIPGLELGTAIVPGMGHGTAIFPVMQQAVFFAYCNTFKPVNADPRHFMHYAGIYADAETPARKLKIIYKANKLQLQGKGVGKDTITYDLIPRSDSSFFMREAPDRFIIFSKDHFKVVLRDNERVLFNKL